MDTWEARMAARAKERDAQQRREAMIEAVKLIGEQYEANKQRPWLNGWPRTGPTSVLMGTASRCVGCGKTIGITCVAFPPDWEPPGPEPDWPFTDLDCPIH